MSQNHSDLAQIFQLHLSWQWFFLVSFSEHQGDTPMLRWIGKPPGDVRVFRPPGLTLTPGTSLREQMERQGVHSVQMSLPCLLPRSCSCGFVRHWPEERAQYHSLEGTGSYQPFDAHDRHHNRSGKSSSSQCWAHLSCWLSWHPAPNDKNSNQKTSCLQWTVSTHSRDWKHFRDWIKKNRVCFFFMKTANSQS